MVIYDFVVLVKQLSILVTSSDRLIIQYGQLTILYGKSIRGPLIAYLRMTKDSLGAKFHKGVPAGNISPELNVDKTYRACDGDYASEQTRLHKGHLQRAENLGDQETAKGKYKFSVTLPQYPAFNTHAWFELENYETLFVKHHLVTDSFAGGLYSDDLGMCGRLRIPSHFFKILVGSLPDGQCDVEVFILKHRVYPVGIPTCTFHRSMEELYAMDTEGVIPQFRLERIRYFNHQDYKNVFGNL